MELPKTTPWLFRSRSRPKDWLDSPSIVQCGGESLGTNSRFQHRARCARAERSRATFRRHVMIAIIAAAEHPRTIRRGDELD
jgi:hypothetical protein